MEKSISSNLMSAITAFRNPNGPDDHWVHMDRGQMLQNKFSKVLFAEVGYLSVVPAAAAETALNGVAFLFARLFDRNVSTEVYEKLESSTFSLFWACGNSVLNFKFVDLYQSESGAKAWISSLIRNPVDTGYYR